MLHTSNLIWLLWPSLYLQYTSTYKRIEKQPRLTQLSHKNSVLFINPSSILECDVELENVDELPLPAVNLSPIDLILPPSATLVLAEDGAERRLDHINDEVAL